MFSM